MPLVRGGSERESPSARSLRYTSIPGMEVDTDSPAVVEARKTILELLIANHPLDCLTCEKAGACKLQDYCYRYGVKESPFAGEKHDYAIDDSNPFIVRDLNKCILCGACVRACEELTGADNLFIFEPGFHRKATTAGDVDYINSDCVFCGQCVAVCPTGP
jgi:formate dehydrogenase alpha subunit